MYKSEKAFSAALLRALKNKSVMAQRIETGETGRGVPDIWLRYPYHELWVEVKNDYRQQITGDMVTIPWRAGQQAWHYEYFRQCHRSVVTVMACADGFIILELTKHYPRNEVPLTDCYVCKTLNEVVKRLDTISYRG